MAALPLNGWKLLLGTWVKYGCDIILIPANAIETAVQAPDNPQFTSANH